MSATSIPVRYLREAEEAKAHARGIAREGNDCFADGSDLDIGAIATALAFIDHGPVIHLSSLRSRLARSSYGLKHDAERWGAQLGFASYIANGDFLAAARFRNVPLRPRGLNSQVALTVTDGWLRRKYFGARRP